MSSFFEVTRSEVYTRRFKETVELFEAALALQRQNLRRRHPDLAEEEIDALLQEWLLDRRGDHDSPEFRRSTRWNHLMDG